ncbi:hypothetical protein T4D_6427 [Trichinella pseudospiralis]|uniref:Uncharacterized protein n=1 Tax=Trichinella pseudospiralis TaxID=6337 RepID=A0A0V1F322_TRIPS|nr:hypothetical protein T4D_6427 [Trichinella pseudospiralis]
MVALRADSIDFIEIEAQLQYLCLVFWNLQQAAVVLLMSMTMYGKVGLLCRHLPYQASMKSTLPPSRQVGNKLHADSDKWNTLQRCGCCVSHGGCTKS